MLFLNPNVISNKIHNNNSLLKTKSFIASLGVHATILVSIFYFMDHHPIPLPNAEETIMISLAEFTSTSGDINRIEQLVQPKKILNPIPKVQPKTVENIKPTPTITTPQVRPSLTPSVSPEASAPLAVPQSNPTAPLSNRIDSPTSNTIVTSKEPPKAPVSDAQPSGAALGHIRAMIENAITYPAIARKLRLEGVVLVTFILKSDGTVETAHVKSTSGSNILDNKAIQTILSLSGDYPVLGKTFELSIPIAFNLHKS